MSQARGQSPMRKHKRQYQFKLTTNEGNKLNKLKNKK
tara:strand:+ start:26 stop:136 length:111 start_codon:yes stop_codon:yes gene_type:complete